MTVRQTPHFMTDCYAIDKTQVFSATNHAMLQILQKYCINGLDKNNNNSFIIFDAISLVFSNLFISIARLPTINFYSSMAQTKIFSLGANIHFLVFIQGFVTLLFVN